MGSQTTTDQRSAGIGDMLREAREAKNLSVASAAMHTNLRKDIIEKLELGQFGDIGAPVFTRGYLNIYARFLEIDEALVADAFHSVAAERSEQSLRINSANIESQSKPYKRSMTRSWISLLLVLLVGGGLIAQLLDDDSWLLKQIRGTFQDPPAASVERDTPQPAQESDKPEFTVEVDSPQTQSDIPALTSIEDLAVDDRGTSSATDLSLTSVEENDSATSGQVEPEPAQAQQTATDPAASAAAGKAVLKTSQENWIEVRDGSGKVVSSKIYPAGAEIELSADDGPYRLNIGRPNAISLLVNGKESPLATYRKAGQTRLFNLSIPNE